MTGTHFSKAFLASIPPFNPATQTDASDTFAAACLFDGFERTVAGGTSGALAMCRWITKTGNLPDEVVVTNPTKDVK